MAKSDSDSNGLRQDQPECLPGMGRVRREHTQKGVIAIVSTFADTQSGVTELPGLTSDPIYTADRRGGILMSSGPHRRPGRAINPSSRPRTDVRMVRRDRGESSPVQAAFVFNPECPVTLKGVGLNRTTRVARRDRRGADRPSSLRIYSDGRLILKPVEGGPPRHAITSMEGCRTVTHRPHLRWTRQ